MERCPCCNARLRERTVCSRCKSDLSQLINSEKTAQYRLSQAIQFHLQGNIGHCIAAIGISLGLKKIRLVVIFREFLIQQQCQEVLDLLAEKQLIFAKKKLYTARKLIPYSMQLQHLNSFCDYLLAQSQDHTDLLPHSVPEALADMFHYPM